MQTTKGNWGKYILYTVLSILAALGNLGVAFVINQILRDFMGGSKVPTTVYFFYLAGSVAGYVLCRWFLSRGIIRFTQGLLATTRLEILKMVLRAPLSVMVKKKNK